MKSQPLVARGRIQLKHFDPGYDGGLDKHRTKKHTAKDTRRIGELQQLLYANSRQSLLLLFQGLDASGKDGSVRAVLHHVNPAGVETANFKQPSAEEKAHDFLWRVHQAVPRYGNIGVFNRSHYEAVLVERVLQLAPREEWEQRFAQIVDWERMLVQNHVVILKFFLHLSPDEQAKRFKERLRNPEKNWKFSSSDLTTREHWDAYMTAYEDVLTKTSSTFAPWHIVPADHHWYRDHVIARATVEALEAMKLDWPKPAEDLSKIKIK